MLHHSTGETLAYQNEGKEKRERNVMNCESPREMQLQLSLWSFTENRFSEYSLACIHCRSDRLTAPFLLYNSDVLLMMLRMAFTIPREWILCSSLTGVCTVHVNMITSLEDTQMRLYAVCACPQRECTEEKILYWPLQHWAMDWIYLHNGISYLSLSCFLVLYYEWCLRCWRGGIDTMRNV